MGNQTSQPSKDFQRQFQQLQDQVKRQQRQQHVDLNHLQKQIYYAQMKMQEMKQNYNQQNSQYTHHSQNTQQYYNQQYPPQNQYHQQSNNDLLNMQANNKMASLLNSPDLKREMSNNPSFGVQIIELILKEFGTQLSDSQYNKINEYLERANYQTHQQQLQQHPQQQYQQQQLQNQKQSGIPHYQQQHQQLQNQNQVQLHRHANMNLTQKYQSEEDEERERFEKEQERRRKEFEEKQSRRRNEYNNQMRLFEASQTNAYTLLGVPANYTMDQLKIAYRKKAIMTHPDKGGSPELFDEVTKAYFSLLEKLKNKESDKQFLDLKSQSKNYIEQQSGDNRQNINLEKMTVSKESFNVKAFNKIFEENKIADPNDIGYSDWLKDDSNVKEPPKVFSTKFNLDVFNSTFENWKDQDEHLSREIVVRDEPQALVLSKTGYSELGVDRIDDFSKSDINARNLGYTDLKQAYSRNGIMNTKSITPRESYKNIQEYEKARSNISYQMSEEDIRRQEYKKQQEEEAEALRVQRVQSRDNMHFNSYNRVHQLMLEKLK
jgi:curved DNA-binding protein CbpA